MNKVWRSGKFYKLDNLPSVINGEKHSMVNTYHRTNGPAIIWKDGSKDYYINGKIKKAPEKETLWITNKETI